MSGPWRIVEHRGLDGLSALESDWRRLTAALPDPAAHHLFEVQRAWAACLRADADLRYLALTDGEQVRAICPVQAGRQRVLGVPTGVWTLTLGRPDFLQDVLCPPGEAERVLLPLAASHLQRAGSARALVMGRVLARSAAWRCLASVGRLRRSATLTEPCDEFDCRESFETLRGRLSRNFRGNLRKARNKLAALAGVEFANVAAPVSREAAFETFLALEESGWKGGLGTRTALRFSDRLVAFYRAIAALPACEFNCVSAEGRCIASQLCVRTGGEYMVVKIAYDQQYERVAPGQLLMEWVLERCCRDPGVERLSLVTGSSWHADWRPIPTPAYWACVGLGPGGPLVSGLHRLRFRVGPTLHRLLALGRRGGPPSRGASDS